MIPQHPRPPSVRELHKAAQPGLFSSNREILLSIHLLLSGSYVIPCSGPHKTSGGGQSGGDLWTILQNALVKFASSTGRSGNRPRPLSRAIPKCLLKILREFRVPVSVPLATTQERTYARGEPHHLRGGPRDAPGLAQGRTAGFRETMTATQLPGVVDLLGDTDMQGQGVGGGGGPTLAPRWNWKLRDHRASGEVWDRRELLPWTC